MNCPQYHLLPEVRGGAVRRPQSYTPQHLAEKILTSRSLLEGERSR